MDSHLQPRDHILNIRLMLTVEAPLFLFHHMLGNDQVSCPVAFNRPHLPLDYAHHQNLARIFLTADFFSFLSVR